MQPQVSVVDFDSAVPNAAGTLRVLNTGGGLVRYLGENSSMCKYIADGTIQMRFFAGGAAGQVADITFPGMGTQSYVVKVVKQLKEITYVTSEAGLTLEQVWDLGFDELGYNYDIYLELNGKDSQRILRNGDRIILPAFATECKLSKPLTVTNTAEPTDDVTFPAGSYLCSKNTYSEYANSLFASELLRQQHSINFVHTFSFATCSEMLLPAVYARRLQSKGSYDPKLAERYVAQYTFMEKIDGTLRSLLTSNPTPAELDGWFIQIMHAMAVYQTIYQLQHNDLHDDNVFYLEVKPDTTWKNKTVSLFNYFSYRVGNKSVYIPALRYLMKIGDWGLSIKYSTPIIGDLVAVTTGYDQQDGEGPWVPNFYDETYDLMTILTRFLRTVQPTPFLKRVVKWLVGDDDIDIYNQFIVGKTWRPVLGELLLPPLEGKRAYDLLRNDEVMGEYLKPPPTSMSSIELGQI